MEDYLDDNVIIPDDIKNMTKEELELEIAKLEAEAAKKSTHSINIKKKPHKFIMKILLLKEM